MQGHHRRVVPRSALDGAARPEPALVPAREPKLKQALNRDGGHARDEQDDVQRDPLTVATSRWRAVST